MSCSGITGIEFLQTLQSRAARIVIGGPYDVSSVPLRKELGWLSMKKYFETDIYCDA